MRYFSTALLLIFFEFPVSSFDLRFLQRKNQPEHELTSTTSPNCPLGTWTPWKEVLQCNEECGSCGSRILRRTCASECPCSGPSKIEERCNIQVCDYPKPSCCPPFKLMMLAGEFVCGPQEEAVAARFIAKSKKNPTNLSHFV